MDDEALIQAMVQAGIAPDKLDELKNRIAIAQSLQYQQQPEGRGYGGVYTAANPLEFMGTALQAYKAKKQLGQSPTELQGPPSPGQTGPLMSHGSGLYGQQGQILNDTASARAKYMAELLRTMRNNP